MDSNLLIFKIHFNFTFFQYHFKSNLKILKGMR
ncbi:hypothetical protein HH_1860 [Helicobacter hepaticus ATCC 51449]|uniref:Uncharacterized protein n=1 Tax=Helicobacter hepaticus (strain ATCC 51449 / 3B1) TaxID=235279 RepID=Q7VF19_HELHP|nr:hypothetical protein HH_1860 [Helicobacter hepaticus ATCC 51449]